MERHKRVLSDNPLIYWRLGESSGTTAVNENSSGPDGTYGSGLLRGEPGLVASPDNAIRIAAPSPASYVLSPTLSGTALTGIEAWFRTDSVADNRDIVSLRSNGQVQMLVYHDRLSLLGVWWQGHPVLYSDNYVSTNETHHVAVWFESASNTTFMMIDGVTQQNAYSGNLFAVTNPELQVGSYSWAGTVYSRMLGEIDEVAAYDTPVDASTFADRYSFKAIAGELEAFAYDANGNRTSHEDSSGTTSLSYLPLSNRLTSKGAETLTHDAAGNRIADWDGNRSFGYSNANRPNEVLEFGTPVATYRHNALGQRVRKTTSSADVVYLYDLYGNLIAEHTSSGVELRDYVWFNGTPVAQVGAGEVFSFLHVDHLGTPRLATDESQAVVWRWESDAFGVAAPDEDPDGDGNGTVVNLRFPGQYYDLETGFYYNYYRTYDPATGRYLESDPIGLIGGLNTYGYVGADPVNATDRLGLYIDSARASCASNPYICAEVVGMTAKRAAATATAGLVAAVAASHYSDDIAAMCDIPENYFGDKTPTQLDLFSGTANTPNPLGPDPDDDEIEVKFGSNTKTKIRKHIDQVRNRHGTRENIPRPGRGGTERVQEIIRDRVAQGGGYRGTYARQAAIFYEDGRVVYVLRPDGRFWTILRNTR